MKFFKCHCVKFKDNKVMYVPEQFNEIGPDSFCQTNFDVIILSEKTTTLCDHAFASVSNCYIYVPQNVTDIGLYAFDNMGSSNMIFCYKNTYAQKFFDEYHIEYSTNVEVCFEKAASLKHDDDKINDSIENIINGIEYSDLEVSKKVSIKEIVE